jgi:hypothetical protein
MMKSNFFTPSQLWGGSYAQDRGGLSGENRRGDHPDPTAPETEGLPMQGNVSLKWGDFHYRIPAGFDPATGGAEKNFRAATAY